MNEKIMKSLLCYLQNSYQHPLSLLVTRGTKNFFFKLSERVV